MSVKTNTTKTINSASGVLGQKCENTQKNMDKLLKKMGCKGTVKKVKIVIPLIPGSKDDVLFLGVNGVKFYFQRGKTVEMPEPLLRFAVDCQQIPASYLDMLLGENTASATEDAKRE